MSTWGGVYDRLLLAGLRLSDNGFSSRLNGRCGRKQPQFAPEQPLSNSGQMQKSIKVNSFLMAVLVMCRS